jgi:hypothetical protein
VDILNKWAVLYNIKVRTHVFNPQWDMGGVGRYGQFRGGTKSGGHPFSGKRIGRYPFFQSGKKKIFIFWVISGTEGAKMLQNCSEKTFGVVLRCFKLRT